MTNSILLGRAASYLSHFASGLCLTLVASAFLYALEAQARPILDAKPVACRTAC